jgi:adenosylcobinamide-phosphate synthase
MNYLPARITWLVIVAIAALLPAFSGRKAWRVGLRQHVLLLGPNSGWSEAATAGALQRQLVGPIWLKGVQVTDLWIGDASDPPLQTAGDVKRAVMLAVLSGVTLAATAAVIILRSSWPAP